METINYIIPVSNTAGPDFDQRLQNLQFSLDHFISKQSGVRIHAIMVEQIVDSTLPSFINNLSIPEETENFFFDLIPVECPVFVKPWLYNIGVNASPSDHIILAESDVTSVSFLKEFLDYVKEKDLKWCFMWDKVFKYTEEATKNLVTYYEMDEKGATVLSPEPGLCEGMGVYFRKDFFLNDLHGANEMFQKLGGNDNELAYRAHKLSGTYECYPHDVIHMWHSPSHMKSGAVHNLNDNLKLFLKEGDNYKKVNDFLSTKKLGNVYKPLHVTDQLIQRFSNLEGEDTAINNILIADPWTPESSYDLQEWIKYLKQLVSWNTYKKVAVGCLISHVDDYKKISHSDIKLITFMPDADSFKIDSLLIRNYDRLGYVERVSPPIKKEEPVKESVVYSVVKKGSKLVSDDPFQKILDKMDSEDVVNVEVSDILSEPVKEITTDDISNLLEEGANKEEVLERVGIDIDGVKKLLEDPEAKVRVAPKRKEEPSETMDIEALKKALSEKDPIIKPTKKPVVHHSWKEKKQQLIESRVYGEISVVIPCHNSQDFILSHIDEIMYNEFKEIVIVDWDSDEYLGKSINNYYKENKDSNIIFKKYNTTEFFNAGLPASVKPIPVLNIMGQSLDSNVKIVPIKDKGPFDTERALNIGSRACVGLNLFYYIPGKDNPSLCDAYKEREQAALSFDPTYKPGFAPATSLITTCMNREDFLLYSLPTWIGRGFKEIIIVDWSSKIPVVELLQHFAKYRDETIKVVRVDDMDHFNAGVARNTGTREATGDYILYTDSDMRQISLESVKEIDDCFYHGINKMAPFGTCFMSRKVLDKVNGYTELMPGYGWEDNDLYDRLEEAGIKRRYFKYGFARHIDHDDKMRIKHRGQSGKTLVETLFENTFQRDNWKQWSCEDRQEEVSYFTYILKNYYKYKNPPSMKRNLLYYIYPLECPMLHFNLRLLSKYQSVFTRKIICLGLDKNTLKEKEVEELFRIYGITNYELMSKENVPSLGDGAYLMEMLAKVRSKDSEEITFFAHAKGVSPGRRDKMWEESVWVELMYRLNLSDTEDIESRLRHFPCVGTFKVKDHRHQVPAPWYYAGTFYWFNHEAIFSREDWFVPGRRDKWRSEAYLGVRFKEDEVSCIQNREGSLLYHRSTYDKIVDSSYPRNFYLSVTVGRDITLLRKFMQYYSSLGIHKFLVTVHHNDPAFVREVNGIIGQYATKVGHTWSGIFTEERKIYNERILIQKTCADEDWVIYADLDEFQVYCYHLPYVLEDSTKAGYNYLQGQVTDRVARDTNYIKLPVINPGSSLHKQFMTGCNLSEERFGNSKYKVVAAKAKLPMGLYRNHIGPTDIELKKSDIKVSVQHFKWHYGLLKNIKELYENRDKDPNNSSWYEQMLILKKDIDKENKISLGDCGIWIGNDIKV